MKNLLLTLALGVGCCSPVLAQSFTDVISLSIDGKPLASGEKLVVAPMEGFDPYRDAYMFNLEIDVDNLTGEDRRCSAKVTALTPDTDIIKDSEKYPFAFLCTPAGCLPDRPDNFAEGIITVPEDAADMEFTLDVHASGTPEATTEPATYLYELTLLVNEDDTDPKFTFTVEFNPRANSGISAIETEQATPEYFDLHGRRISRPGNAPCIKRMGGKAYKIMPM
ncbi:MAG: hypothetical protein NC328_02210 [Muribaculum sp.]|nr:hypothetical protein [Muribaculum sp.]